MDETDELRNIKLALSHVLDEYVVDEQEQQEETQAFETICEEKQSSITSSRTKISSVIASKTSEQPNTTREPNPTHHSHQRTKHSSRRHPRSHKKRAASDSNQTKKNHSTTSSLEYQKHAVYYCFSEAHSVSSESSSCDESYYSSQTNETENFNHLENKETIPLKYVEDQEQISIVTTESNWTQEQEQHTSSTFSPRAGSGVVPTPGAFLMRGSTVTGQAQVGMITPFEQTRVKFPDDMSTFRSTRSLFEVTLLAAEDLPRKILSFTEAIFKKKKVWYMIGVFASIVIVVVLTVIVRSHAKTSLPESPPINNESTKMFEKWPECHLEEGTDLLMIDPMTQAKYQDLEQKFTPNKQVEICSPQHLALLHLSKYYTNTNQSNKTSAGSSVSFSRYILSVFYFSLQGNKWHNNAGWISSPNECQWHGVECSKDGQITGIRLAVNNLVGTLPDEIYQLKSLLHMELWKNDISGTISSNGIQNLSHLTHLDIELTSFSGPLPPELFALTALSTLRLPLTNPPTVISGSNLAMLSNLTTFLIPGDMLGESIPTEIGFLTNLVELDIIRSDLKGQIPSELALLSMLQVLLIDASFLAGTIPDALFESNKGWRELHLGSSSLTGTIPSLIGTQERLEKLILFGNGLSGSIPTEIANCSSLRILNLSINRLEGNIPTEIGLMNTLETLNLHFNGLTGTLPTEIAGLDNLTSISVDGCPKLEGTISPLFCRHQTQVNVFSFGCGKNPLSTSCLEQTCCQLAN